MKQADRRRVWELQTEQRDFKCSERARRGSFGPFTTVQTSPAGRPSLGQVGHIRKCVFVISADVGIRAKAESLSRRLFSLSRAGLLSKPREDKQRCLACQGPVCLFLSLQTLCQLAILQLLLPISVFLR